MTEICEHITILAQAERSIEETFTNQCSKLFVVNFSHKHSNRWLQQPVKFEYFLQLS